MRNEQVRFIGGFLSLSILAALLSCIPDTTPLQIKSRQPPDELAYYSDPLDMMREDLWDRAGYLYREEQVQNFKQADIRFENGILIIRTKTGSFSKGGFASRYGLRGDFDIRMDCRMDFIKGVSGMDQLFNFGVLDRSKKFGSMSGIFIGLSMPGGLDWDWGNLFSNSIMDGRKIGGNSKKIQKFSGTFRILRDGKRISALYKLNGATEWNLLDASRLTDNDMFIGFQVRNFFADRTSIRAEHLVTVELDSFEIAAAEEIIEDEI